MLAKLPASKHTTQVGVALTVTLSFVLVVAVFRAMPSATGNPSNPAAVPLTIQASGELLRTSGSSFPQREPKNVGVALLEHRMVQLFDLTTGLTKQTFSVGMYPMAVTRSTRNEVVVSDAVILNMEIAEDFWKRGLKPPPGVRDERLLILDAANLVLKRTVPLQGRKNYKLYTSAIALSNSERYFYYLTDDEHVVVVDLDGVADLGIRSPLPAGCGYALLSALGPDYIIAACPDSGDVQIIDQTGAILEQNFFSTDERGLYTDVPAQRKNTVRINFGVLTPNGHIGGLTATGTLMYKNADGSLNSVQTIPRGRVAVGQVYQVDPAHLLVAYRTYGEDTIAGFAVFNLSSMKMERDVKLAEDALWVVPNGPSAALVLRKSGFVDVMDFRSDRVRSIKLDIDAYNSVLVP